jgi:hypothetical protein
MALFIGNSYININKNINLDNSFLAKITPVHAVAVYKISPLKLERFQFFGRNDTLGLSFRVISGGKSEKS